MSSLPWDYRRDYTRCPTYITMAASEGGDGEIASRRLGRHREAGDFELHRAQGRMRGEIERFPIVATKGDVGRLRLAMDDAAELLALGIDDIDAARSAGIDVAQHIELDTVRTSGLRTFQLDEDALGLGRQEPVRHHVEGA